MEQRKAKQLHQQYQLAVHQTRLGLILQPEMLQLSIPHNPAKTTSPGR